MKIIKYKELTYDFYKSNDLDDLKIKKIVKEIIEEVKSKGDLAVKKYTKKFDDVDLDKFEISKNQIKEAYSKTNAKTILVLKKAISNIEFFAKNQMRNFKDFEVKRNGIVFGQKIMPINSVGCYVPGGRYPLPSSALMSIIPAKTAGVENIIVCSPKIKDIVIVASDMAGADRIFNVGGIQAIASLCFGTKTIPKVNKIVGPGNKYVNAAKKQVYGKVGIDFIASASEVLIIADKFANPKFIVADMLAQLEHDIDAKANLITDSFKIAKAVNIELQSQIKKLATKEIIEKSIKNSKIILVENLEDAVKIANKYAPEHLEIDIKNPNKIIEKLKNYGSLFIGKYSAEVFCDYCAGPNHILPTNKASKYTGGLSVGDFLKVQTYQKINKRSDELIKIATSFAEIEGLDGHRNAAMIRLEKQQ